ncbi:MAG: spermidine synthase [Bacteroidetes bacterium]|nr:MAG: spermidine synthase [Bacteroidota bacterium]
MKKYLLELIILFAGIITMAFELAGSRILGPYFGTSIFIWTSLIGIIMGSLSIGYWAGGQLSVKKSDLIVLSRLLLAAGIFIFITAFGHDYILKRVVKYIADFRLQVVFSSAVLFGPASVFLGGVLPYAAKLKINSMESSGVAIGRLYALSTIGSIAGTFLSGFVLLPYFGFLNIMYFLTGVLLLFSFWIFFISKTKIYLAITIVSLFVLSSFWIKSYINEVDYIDTDTQYNRVFIYNTTDKATGRPIKMLAINNEHSSAKFLDGDGLVFEVLKYYHLVEHFNPGFKSSLMIGGSGYAFPKAYLKKYPEATMDVLEIDPELTQMAYEHFDLPKDKRLRIFHEDGRTFMNKGQGKYDALFMDAYKSMITVPYQLTTVEAITKMYDMLNDDGVILANLISTLSPKNNAFLRAELATYKSVFPQVYLFAVQYPNPAEKQKEYFQNFMLVGLKSEKKPGLYSGDEELNEFLKHLVTIKIDADLPILTDDYAPVEYYTSKALDK